MKIKPNKKTTIKTANLTTLNKISEKMDNLYKTNSQYCDIKQSLERIKKTFGEINAMLIAPGVIEKIDKNPDWHDFFEAMKKTSCIYFSILSDWKHGKFEGSMKKLSPLEKKTQELKRQATAKLF
jgi:hypothetical protein